jgi:hypothetical protein
MGDIISTKRHVLGAIQMVMHNDVLKKTDSRVFPYDLIQTEMADYGIRHSEEMADSSLVQPVISLH